MADYPLQTSRNHIFSVFASSDASRFFERWLGGSIPTGLCPSAQGCPGLPGLPWVHPERETMPTVLWPGDWVCGMGTATTVLRLVMFGNSDPG